MRFQRLRNRLRRLRHGVWTRCETHEWWDDDKACVRCGYVFKGEFPPD